MLNGQTVLVVEAEFLIALDIQRMLETLGAGQMLFARSIEEVDQMAANLSTVALAIIEIRPGQVMAIEKIGALMASGIAVILCSAGSKKRGYPEFPDIPVLVKPMSEDDMTAAIEAALRRKP